MASEAAAAPLSPQDLERALAAWREHDSTHALHPLDREAIRAIEAQRALVLEQLAALRSAEERGPRSGARAPVARDLYNACARLGRMLADAGASPSLAVVTLDGAAESLGRLGIAFDGDRLAAARASLAEGFVAVVVDQQRALARRAWEYPACAVRLGADLVALAAGYPADDGESLADWAARVALASSRDGYKRVIVQGEGAACAALGEALGTIGIRIVDAGELAPPARGLLSLFTRARGK